MADQDRGMPDLAGRLDRLFTIVPGPGGRGRWSNENASAELGRHGISISAAYLSQLRHGKRDNPSARHLNALAGLFSVPISYFFTSRGAEMTASDLLLSAAIQDRDVRAIIRRVQGLSPEGRAIVKATIDHIRKVEQLPDEQSPIEARQR